MKSHTSMGGRETGYPNMLITMVYIYVQCFRPGGDFIQFLLFQLQLCSHSLHLLSMLNALKR